MTNSYYQGAMMAGDMVHRVIERAWELCSEQFREMFNRGIRPALIWAPGGELNQQELEWDGQLSWRVITRVLRRFQSNSRVERRYVAEFVKHFALEIVPKVSARTATR